LVVCLGVGTTKESLSRTEAVCVPLLALFFAFVGVWTFIREWYDRSNNVGVKRKLGVLQWCQYGANLVYLWWIYFALQSTQERLVHTNQTRKLSRFKALANLLGFFVLLFTLLTALTLSINKRVLNISWQHYWFFMGLVGFSSGAFWILLDFCVVSAVSILWRPSRTSSHYALSSQLPSSELEANQVDGLEMVVPQFSIGSPDNEDESDDDNNDYEGYDDHGGDDQDQVEFDAENENVSVDEDDI